ncbi:MAG: hypothetical protein V4726_17220 [Verrucomicrobiota bacterium]
MKRLRLLLISSLAGLAAGFGYRAFQYHRQLSPAAEAAPPALTPSAALPEDRSSLPPGPPEESALIARLKTDLARSAALSDDVTRWLHWMTAVEKAAPADYPRLASMAKDLPGALEALAAKWIESDPRSLFDACVGGNQGATGFPTQELARLLFNAWPRKDPAAVFAALESHPSIQLSWQTAALDILSEIDPERSLITMSRIRIYDHSFNMTHLEKWIAADPAHAARVALENPYGTVTGKAVERIGREWARRDAEAALAFASSHNNTELSRDLANHVISHWVERDLSKASEWLAAADESTRNRLLPSFVAAWGQKDAAAALQWSLTNTDGGRQRAVIEALVRETAEKKPDAAAAMVTGMEASPGRRHAAVIFAGELYDIGWMQNIPENADGTAKTIQWLNQLDPEARKAAIGRVEEPWNEQDPQSFANYLLTPAGQDAGPEIMAAAARALGQQKTVEAIQWASGIKSENRDQALSETFGGWINAQPEAAMQWLGKLPPDDPRRESFYFGAARDILPGDAFPELEDEDGNHSPDPAPVRDLARQLATDPAAARATLEKLPLGDTDRARALTRLGLGL